MKKRILWVHGWGMSPHIWQRQHSEMLPDYEHHYISYAGCYDIRDFQRAISLYLHNNCQARSGFGGGWTIVGWSMGGMLALEALFVGVPRVDEAVESVQMVDEFEELAAQTADSSVQPVLQTMDESMELTLQTVDDAVGLSLQPVVNAVESVVVVGGTLCFVNENRTKGWPRRIVERMKKQVAKQPDDTLQQFVQMMLTVSEKESLRQQSESGYYTDYTDPTDSRDSQKSMDFTVPGLEAGLTYLLETDLTSMWEQYFKFPRRSMTEGFQSNGDAMGTIKDTCIKDKSSIKGFEEIKIEDMAIKDISDIKGIIGATWAREVPNAQHGHVPRLLWIHGTDDPICPVGCVPASEYYRTVFIEGAGHLPFLTRQESFYEHLRSFLYAEQ